MRFVNQLTTGAIQYSFRYEWRPLLQSWPEPPPKAMLELPPRGLVLSVEGVRPPTICRSRSSRS